MKTSLRIVLGLLALLALASAVLLAWAWAPDIAPADVEKRWAQAPSTFIEVQGLRVHLRDEGPPGDPTPIVLIHGTSASLHTWDGWTEELRKNRRVIRFDLPGFGLTGPNAADDYSMAVYVRLVLALLDQLGVQRFTMGGNSLGGEVAWATAHAAPQRVERLILVDAAGYAFESTSVPLAFRVAALPGLRAVMGHLLPPGMVENSVRNVYGDPSQVTPELVQRYSDLARRAGNRHALTVRMAQRNTGREQDIRDLKLPTLILWGARDRLIPPVNGERFAQDIAGSQLVVFEGLGHVPQEEDPAATVAVVQQFLRQP
ncbi:MAG: alpha/beta hydrolase [Simplicispira suum]|uniref:alpha/beta fold hydrolase n=1 Tax=Simplicispira suum TaxID=2109915 RepID=UPI001C6BD945|nr:alpha/beta hydrolase [Simplicispira suum]MBW7832420.1 alpha/beta hydrolase [Simplicispira suum]